MSDEIRVYVVNSPDRKNLLLRYDCPVTGKRPTRSAGTHRRSAAERAAARWEAELRKGESGPSRRMGWEQFRDYFRVNGMAGKRPRTVDAYTQSLSLFDTACSPRTVQDFTSANVLRFAAWMRSLGRSEATVGKHLRQLKTAARWANRHGLLTVVPVFEMPTSTKGKRAKRMKGRPITGEEFDRMLDAVGKVVAAEAVESWRFYLSGLWWSGLRLEESLLLEWEGGNAALEVDLEARRPLFRISGEGEKSGQDRMLPMAPEFARMLMAVPEEARSGRIFCPAPPFGRAYKVVPERVGRVVTAIGEAAAIVVDRRGSKQKFASSHDLRRAFGFRWSRLLMPAELMELMRHETMQTTMAYYVGRNAEATADKLWEAVGHTLGYTPQERSDQKESRREQNKLREKG